MYFLFRLNFYDIFFLILCMCVCTHTHTHIYIYCIYIYICSTNFKATYQSITKKNPHKHQWFLFKQVSVQVTVVRFIHHLRELTATVLSPRKSPELWPKHIFLLRPLFLAAMYTQTHSCTRAAVRVPVQS